MDSIRVYGYQIFNGFVISLLIVLLHGTSAASEPVNSPPAQRLNNLVSQLLAISPQSSAHEDGYNFVNPREGWIYIQSTAHVGSGGKTAIYLDQSAAANRVIEHPQNASTTREIMLYLPKGERTLFVEVEGKTTFVSKVVVRTMPETSYSTFPFSSFIDQYPRYDFEYLDEIGMIDVVNTFTCRTGQDGAINDTTHLPITYDDVYRLKRRGKRLLKRVLIRNAKTRDKPKAMFEDVYNHWANFPRLTDSQYDGIIIDEFSHHFKANFPVFVEAARKALDDYPDKLCYLYITGDPKQLKGLIDELDHPRTRFALEVYLAESSTEEKAWNAIQNHLSKLLDSYKKVFPGIESKIIFVLGIMSTPPETANVNPSVNYKTYLDMQFYTLATDPACQGLGGIQVYNAAYVDEEIMRWTAKLFRHYCLEGKTDRLSDDPYKLTHIDNPDFDNHLEGWSVLPAEPKSISTKQMDGLGLVQGRMGPRGVGESTLWMKRSHKQPNRVSQTIKNLIPGEHYSVEMYVSDYQDSSQAVKHAATFRVDGATRVGNKSICSVVKSFRNETKQHGKGPIYFNYHRLIFRAKAETATLTLSDWSSPQEAGGPIGQELIYNFIEVEPYLMDNQQDE